MVLGYPAAGKSSLVKKLTAGSRAVILNRDTEGGTIAALLPKMDALLSKDIPVVLDNLFPTIEVRKPFLDLAKKHDALTMCFLMGATIEDAQFNVVQRAISILGEFPSPEVIKKAKHTNIFPPTVLFKYKKEFQKPTLDEGFHDIKVVPFVREDDLTLTNKALLLDYDCTLRECIGGNGKYPTTEDQIEIKPGRKEILQSYKDKGYILLGVSNQSGIAKGELTDHRARELFDYTNKQLGIDIEYRFCPHQSAPISCYCRKPLPGLFVEFMLKHKLNRKECLMVGDLTSDKTFAFRAGIKYVDQAEFFK